MFKNKIINTVTSIVLLLSIFITGYGTTYAQNTAVCEGAQIAGSSLDCRDGRLSDAGFSNVIKNVINIASIVVGIAAVIMILVGGFRYIISGGDANGVSGAKNTILYAIIGLVIVLFAQVIVRFVYSNVK